MQALHQSMTQAGCQHNISSIGNFGAALIPARHSQRKARTARPRSTSSSVALGFSQLHSSSINSSSTGLASYTLLERTVATSSSSTRQHRWSNMWFEAIVQTVVKNLDGNPFLLRVTVRPLLQIQLVRLPSSELDKGWQHIQQTHLAGSDVADDAVIILVHPVVSEQQPCAVQQVQAHECTNCPASQAGCSYDELQTPELLAGYFGDCCSDEGQQQQSSTSDSSNHRRSSAGDSTESSVTYYGMVVQCKDQADSLQGCYLLKTMQLKQHHGGGSGCHCTHYSLNRVCKGPSLRQQYQDSWLA